MVLAAVAALLLTLLLIEISYFLSSDNSYNAHNSYGMPPPIPEAPLLNQIFVALCWIGLAALIAFSIVALALLINRIRHRKEYANELR
jgi:TRAP-type C4-dicarboxylate transport system permease small subunit